jgi:hypothetical protein
MLQLQVNVSVVVFFENYYADKDLRNKQKCLFQFTEMWTKSFESHYEVRKTSKSKSSSHDYLQLMLLVDFG